MTAVVQPNDLTWHSLTEWHPSAFPVQIMPLRCAGGCTSCMQLSAGWQPPDAVHLMPSRFWRLNIVHEPCQRAAGVLPSSSMNSMPCCSGPQSRAQGVLQEAALPIEASLHAHLSVLVYSSALATDRWKLRHAT